ncbi:putative gamma-glutamyl phosphate reductase [Smittium mucronatum]|uniref:glutamate-5-semialdehyde dehydrogenase n=1 Tax=Smittium mucronatum TaxID=133383 RepID=A0A1R0GS15_9FUNG|nr:putative gamma-glutamyl phosphate reductase [Smittium mucronatum]
MSVLDVAIRARESSNLLQIVEASQRSAALQRIKQILSAQKNKILEANELDMKFAKKQVEAGNLSESLYKRLDIKGNNDEKFDTMLKGIDEVDALEDPVGKITLSRKLDEGLSLYKVTCPVGVLLVIFEARPEVVVNISCLAIKSGNAAILKGGKEASHTNRILASLISEAVDPQTSGYGLTIPLSPEFPINTIQLVETRESIHELLKLDRYIDMAIPRGSNDLVRYVQNNTRIPVLGHADGLCSIFLDESCDLDKAIHIVVDAKTDYPAACNSVETCLVHEKCLDRVFPKVAQNLLEHGVKLHLDKHSKHSLHNSDIDFHKYKDLIVDATAEDYKTEYNSLDLAVKVVSSINEAISHIGEYGSKHTDCIVTENKENAELFMKILDSAGVFWNASTRFADGFRYGFGAEVGVSTNKTHARGPVGLEGLTIYKYKLIGNGQGAGDYGLAAGKKSYLHQDF